SFSVGAFFSAGPLMVFATACKLMTSENRFFDSTCAFHALHTCAASVVRINRAAVRSAFATFAPKYVLSALAKAPFLLSLLASLTKSGQLCAINARRASCNAALAAPSSVALGGLIVAILQ